MDKTILSKLIQIEGVNLKIYKSISLKPNDMYTFLTKYLPTGNDKKKHPDFKHMFDYVESIKPYNYQLDAVKSFTQLFIDNKKNRGILSLPCGCGKTYRHTDA
jgi:superfamily II DNA or RNA helicase